MFGMARLQTSLRSRQRASTSIDVAGAGVSADAVAVELRRRMPALPVKKQHKLLYYAQGHHLGVYGEPLFRDTISAWDMGPVVGRPWKTEKAEGQASAAPERLDERQLNTVGYVVSHYGALSGAELERLTHTETPWIEANRRRRPGSSARISVDAIRDYFAAQGTDDDTIQLDADELGRWLEQVRPYDPSADVVTDDRERLRARIPSERDERWTRPQRGRPR